MRTIRYGRRGFAAIASAWLLLLGTAFFLNRGEDAGRLAGLLRDMLGSLARDRLVSASGVVRIRKDLDDPIEGRDVLVVEGLCASGLSLSYLLRNFQTRHPASLRVCAFLVKRRPRPAELPVDYLGREIPDVFVVGYGLDANERYRNLPYVARLA